MSSLPSAVSSWEIEASIGNSSPLLRKPRITVLPPMRREVTPVAANRRICSRCPARKRSGISMSKERPITCSPGQPKIFSAAWLYRMMCCCSSTVMMPSIAESSRPDSRSASRDCSCSARTRAVTSRRITV